MTYTKDSIVFQPKPIHKRLIDLTNRQFDRLTVLGYAGSKGRKNKYWWCECQCKTIRKYEGNNLRSGGTRSCGCRKLEMLSKRQTTHGETTHKPWPTEYIAYVSAKTRCNNPNNSRYADWGGRGIEFRFKSFEEFLNELGRKPTPEHTLDRINNDGHYEKGNVRWATPTEQGRHTRKNRFLTLHSVTHCISEWAEITGMKVRTIGRRVEYGYCIECTLTLPLRQQCKHRTT